MTPSGSGTSCGGRFAQFGLELHPGKTRLIEFGRRAARDRAARGEGKPETFDVPGLHAHLRDVEERTVLGPAEHDLETDAGQAGRGESRAQAAPCLPIPEQGRWLASVVRGHMAYYAVPGNSDAVSGLPRPGDPALAQGAASPQPEGPTAHLGRMNRVAARWIPPTRTVHPFPQARFAATHPR